MTLRSLIEAAARRFGYAPIGDERTPRGAYWYISENGGPEVPLGKNVLTEKERVNVARLLARTAADWGFPVVYEDGIEGFTNVDPAFPTQLAVGTGVTAATPKDWTMVEPLLEVGGGSTKFFPLSRIYVRETADAYPADIPISVSYYFTIPKGTACEGVGTEVDVQEWSLFGPAAPAILARISDPQVDQDMLARRVKRHTLSADAEVTIRWEVQT